MTMRRRDALKTIGGLAGAATMAKFLPGCGGGDDEKGITTFVYLMMENRTYDHVFGARKLMGMPGDGITAGMTQPDSTGAQVPLFVPTSDAQLCVPADPPHGWDASHRQWNNGVMDGFLREHQASHPGDVDALQYLTSREVPISWAFADAYTTCDRWFASVMGPTLPNRAYWHAATSLGLKVNGDVLDTVVTSGAPIPTIYNRLEDKGIEWRYYFGNLPVVQLMHDKGPHAIDMGPVDGTGKIRRFGHPLDGGQFFRDAAEGKLARVNYIDPTFFENDDHPPVHPILGQELFASIYNALAKSPQWKNILFVITYDEHGGFYDHVAPPTTTDENAEFRQLGFRVPTMVIGPYVKQNYVSSVQYDHTSALKHLQTHFGLEPLNERMNMANDLMDCIDLDRLAANEPADPIELPVVDRYAWPTTDARCTSSGGFREAPMLERHEIVRRLREGFRDE